MSEKKPDQVLREKINRRSRRALIESGSKLGHLTDAQKKPPSQRKSESLRKRLEKRK